jgi:hypothetical protein
MTIQLSPHFSLQEMVRSDFAIRHGLDNTPPPEGVIALRILCGVVLEQIRAQIGAPVVITSGYRSPVVNGGIGGAPTSQHLKGEAADFHIPEMSNLEVVKAIIHSEIVIPFDQLIYEGGEGGWVHISHAAQKSQRRQVLNADFSTGKAAYSALEV